MGQCGYVYTCVHDAVWVSLSLLVCFYMCLCVYLLSCMCWFLSVWWSGEVSVSMCVCEWLLVSVFP